MQDIGSAIKAKREAIQRLQNELDVLERAWALLEGEPVSSSSPSQVPAQERHLSGPPSKGQFSPTSQVGMTIAVLRDAGAPLHVDEIITRIAQRGTTVKKTSLVGSVARLVTEKRIFYRKKPNVYGLIEWQGAKGWEEAVARKKELRKELAKLRSGQLVTVEGLAGDSDGSGKITFTECKIIKVEK